MKKKNTKSPEFSEQKKTKVKIQDLSMSSSEISDDQKNYKKAN